MPQPPQAALSNAEFSDERLNKMTERIKAIREAEKKSHLEIYSAAKLFEKGSWLAKPVKTVMDLIPMLKEINPVTVLDLGCGVGRNCIPLARELSENNCKIDAVDILDFAIEELNTNSKNFGVENSMNSIVSSIDDFKIEPDRYDLIFAVSALEHVSSEKVFIEKLYEIYEGLKPGGIVCLIANSEVNEIDKSNNNRVDPQFEVNMKTEEMLCCLNEVFKNAETLKVSVSEQNYDIPRESFVSSLSTNVVTFVAQKIK